MASRRKKLKAKGLSGVRMPSQKDLQRHLKRCFDAVCGVLGDRLELPPADSQARRRILASIERPGGLCVLLLLPPLPRIDLTHRERQVLSLVLQGLANKTISHRLGVKPPTVAACLRDVYLKLGVHSRNDLALEILLARQGAAAGEAVGTHL